MNSTLEKNEDRAWHVLDSESTLKTLNSSVTGLTEEEAKIRLQKFGPNKLPEEKRDGWFKIFINQFRDSLVYVLLVADIIVFVLKEYTDGFIILFVLLFNAILGTIQEGRAENTLAALKRFVETRASVLRGGEKKVIQDYEVVPGDIILLNEGEKIPADARVIEANNIKLEEAALTGESTPVRKITEIIPGEHLGTAEQKNIVFKGTSVAVGYGKAIVVRTGLETTIGKISQEISRNKTEIPLQKSLREFSKAIVVIAVTLTVLIFFIGIADQIEVKEMFIIAVSIAVAAVPEGLPLVLTMVLATGVWKMAKRRVLVKKLQAVEALGQTQVIAVDKTGTITKNEMVIKKIFIDNEEFRVEGNGYEAMPRLETIPPKLHLAGTLAAICSNAQVIKDEKTENYQIVGDPTEAAMTVFGAKANITKEEFFKKNPLLHDVPFDYQKKYRAVIYSEQNQKNLVVTGAPEVIIRAAGSEWQNNENSPLSEKRKTELEEKFYEYSRQGLRVIAFAKKEHYEGNEEISNLPPLTFLGFFAMEDAIRPDIKEQVEKARKAGIKIIMITGDHRITAEAIAKEAGIYREGDAVLTGTEIDTLSEDELEKTLSKVSVFARVTPEHKTKIISAHRKLGEIIAMTGDGVNDAPSLVAADLGIAMGKIGTEVTKEASDLVLLDDNFGDIMNAVEEGRGMREGIKRTIVYLFSSNLAEIIVITVALLSGHELPLLAAQIIWMNLVTDTFFDVSLGLEPHSKELLEPRFAKKKKLFDGNMARRLFLIAPLLAAGSLLMFYLNHEDITKARTLALTSLVIFQWFNALNCRSQEKSIFKMNFFGNKLLVSTLGIVIILQGLALYTPFLNKILETVPLTFAEILPIIGLGSLIVVIEEIRKVFTRRKLRNAT